MTRFICNIIILMHCTGSMQGMNNKHNDRAIRQSGISSLMRNAASHGKHLIYTLFPLAAECTSMQSGPLGSNVTVAASPVGLSESDASGYIVGASIGVVLLSVCLYIVFDRPKQNCTSNSDNALSPPYNSSSFSPNSSGIYPPSSCLINMKRVMQSISDTSDMDDALDFCWRYGYGNPRDFFGAHACQKESAKAIAVYLHQRCAGMPFDLQMPHELTKHVCKYVRRIDKAVCRKLAAAGYDLTYYDHCLGTAYTMKPSIFFWDKGFVESNPKAGQMLYHSAAGDYDIERGNSESRYSGHLESGTGSED